MLAQECQCSSFVQLHCFRQKETTLAPPKLSVSAKMVPPWCRKIYSLPCDPCQTIPQQHSNTHCTVLGQNPGAHLAPPFTGHEGLPPESKWPGWSSMRNSAHWCQLPEILASVTASAVVGRASLHCLSQGPQAVGRLMGSGVVVEMRAYLQQPATVSVPKWKFHCAKLSNKEGRGEDVMGSLGGGK